MLSPIQNVARQCVRTPPPPIVCSNHDNLQRDALHTTDTSKLRIVCTPVDIPGRVRLPLSVCLECLPKTYATCACFVQMQASTTAQAWVSIRRELLINRLQDATSLAGTRASKNPPKSVLKKRLQNTFITPVLHRCMYMLMHVNEKMEKCPNFAHLYICAYAC